MRVLERELFYFRFLFSLSVCFLYLSFIVVVCVFVCAEEVFYVSLQRAREEEGDAFRFW